jgi:quaternary ammonium compound-resistance protein SugE
MSAWTPWLALLGAGLLEVVWALALDRSDGLSRPAPATLAVTAAAASFVLLSRSLRALPVGTAYAVWVAMGVVGVALVGLARGEAATPARLACLATLVVAIVGLRLTEEDA